MSNLGRKMLHFGLVFMDHLYCLCDLDLVFLGHLYCLCDLDLSKVDHLYLCEN